MKQAISKGLQTGWEGALRVRIHLASLPVVCIIHHGCCALQYQQSKKAAKGTAYHRLSSQAEQQQCSHMLLDIEQVCTAERMWHMQLEIASALLWP